MPLRAVDEQGHGVVVELHVKTLDLRHRSQCPRWEQLVALTHGDGGVVLIDGPEGVPRGQEEGREVVLPRERVSERVGRFSFSGSGTACAASKQAVSEIPNGAVRNRHVLRNDRNPASQALCTGRGVDRDCRVVSTYATGSAGAAWGRERPRKRPVATFPVAGYRFPSRFFLHAVKSERMRRPVRTGARRAPVRTGRYVLPSTYHPRASGELSSTPGLRRRRRSRTGRPSNLRGRARVRYDEPEARVRI